VGGRHHTPDRARVPYLVAVIRLGEPGGAGVAAVEHDGYFVLLRRARGSIGRFGKPEILQHRSRQPVHQSRLTGVLRRHEVQISMDGSGRWMDNVFIERLWRSLKYETSTLKG